MVRAGCLSTPAGPDITERASVDSDSLGSAARTSQNVVGAPLLQDASSLEAIDLLRRWFAGCVSGHPTCNEAASFLGSPGAAAMTQLPNRILDLGPSDGSRGLRLLETNGARAPYAALSHCWGKHRILTTVSGNIKEHLRSIALPDLPKTFQDAVAIARAMGLGYLWIDSLCIIQDDEEDWRRESALMGRVYKDAAITIAASGATDGRGGCFIPRLLVHKPVRLPYLRNELSRPNGEFIHASLFPDEEAGGLDLCPLGQRAWITQEWILSPRIVHYTKSRMLWSCRTLMKSEDEEPMTTTDEQRLLESARRYRDYKAQSQLSREESDPEDMEDFFSNWCDLLSRYTSRSLTYERDRPVAILGLGEEIGTAVGESYTAGILHHSSGSRFPAPHTDLTNLEDRCLILQLFWFASAELSRPAVLQVSAPSWSWTSTIGPVSYHTPTRTARPLVSDLRLNYVQIPGSGAPAVTQTLVSLCTTAKVVRWDPTTCNLGSHERIFPNPKLIFAQPVAREIKGFEFFSRSTLITGAAVLSQKAVFIIGEDGKPAGWAGLDLGTVPLNEDIYLAAFSENEIDGVSDGFNVMFLGARAGLNIDGLGRRFVRLGVGEILTPALFEGARTEGVVLI